MDRLIGASVCPASAKIYKKYFNKFEKFCDDMGLFYRTEACKSSVELWIAHLKKEGLAYSTVLTHISALRHYFRKLDLKVSLDSERLKMLLKGFRNESKAGSKTAVSSSHLLRLDRAAEILAPKVACQFRCMMAVAFYGFLRPSEFCTTASSHALLFRDVHWSKDKTYCHLALRSFKHSKTEARVKLTDNSGEPLKPVLLLQQYLDLFGYKPPGAPLFDVSAQEFGKILQYVAGRAGIKSKLTPHCFRHGGATWARKRGWTAAQIQVHGRWKSDAYLSYIKHN